jgi:hypothetical protein
MLLPVSAALVDSTFCSYVPAGVVEVTFVTPTLSVRPLTEAPLQSVTLIFTGIVLPYLKMLFGGPGLTGCRIPLVL